MAATAWAFYHEAKHKLALGSADGINLSGDSFRLALYKSATSATKDAANLTLSIQSQISNQCTGGAYTTGGEVLANTSWTTTATSVQKFDSDDLVVTATGTDISAVKYGVIIRSVAATSGFLLCYSQLSTSPFDVTTGNTLTIQMATAGIFTLA